MLQTAEREFAEMLKNGIFFHDETRSYYRDEVEALFGKAEKMANRTGFCADGAEMLANEVMSDTVARCIMFHISLQWIRIFGDAGYGPDKMNRMAVSLCQDIAGTDAFREEYSFFMGEGKFDREHPGFREVAIDFVLKARSMDPVSMQRFSGIIFCLMGHPMFSFKLNGLFRAMQKKYGDNWFGLVF